MSADAKGWMRKALRAVVSVIAAVLILIDEVARPIFEPISRAFGRLRIVETLEALVGRLPRYAILACLLVPFAVAEPLKILGLLWIGHGRVVVGVVTLALAYLASFLLVDRIYHAGRGKLLSIGWFAVMMERLVAIREAITAPIRRSEAFLAAFAMARRARAGIRLLLGKA